MTFKVVALSVNSFDSECGVFFSCLKGFFFYRLSDLAVKIFSFLD